MYLVVFHNENGNTIDTRGLFETGQEAVEYLNDRLNRVAKGQLSGTEDLEINLATEKDAFGSIEVYGESLYDGEVLFLENK